MTKAAQEKKEPRGKQKILCVDDDRGMSPEQRRATIAGSSIIRGAEAGLHYARPMFGRDIDFTAYASELRKQADAVIAGDTASIETMLMTQANTLDMMFNHLARKAFNAEYLNQADAHLRHAMKAQAQCRATLEALAEIKNPRAVAFVKQANIAHGHQQVNNGSAPGAVADSCARAQESDVAQSNELLEHHHGERLDIRATRKTSGSDPTLEAVGAIDRAEIR